MEFGTVDFFDRHGYFFLFFITLFPRLTLLFSSVVTGGFFWWIGFFFFPRLLVAILATFAYLQTNPLLVGLSWAIALSGETLEKLGLKKSRSRFVFRTFKTQNHSGFETPSTHQELADKNVIEAQFTKKS